FADHEIVELKEKGRIRRATPVVAPIDGTVVSRRVRPGQFVRNDSGDALYTIAALSTLWLKALAPENEIPNIPLGPAVHGQRTAPRAGGSGAGPRPPRAAYPPPAPPPPPPPPFCPPAAPSCAPRSPIPTASSRPKCSRTSGSQPAPTSSAPPSRSWP